VRRNFSLGGTYLRAGANGSSPDARWDLPFRELSVYGFDFNITPVSFLNFSGNVTENDWRSHDGFRTLANMGVRSRDRRAVDLRVGIPLGAVAVNAFYKRIGDAYDAPGSWGRIGNWINPRGIEGFGGTVEFPIARGLVLDAEAANYNYRLFNRFGVPGSDLLYVRAGLRFPLTSRNAVDFGYERADYNPDAPGGLDRTEQYFNIGVGHQFNPNMSLRLFYQLLHMRNRDDLLGFQMPSYRANILGTQFQVRF
jgi:hypothetical protein